MIDLICIFTTGGVILFYQAYSQTVKKEIIQSLIQNNLAKEKDEQSVLIDSYRVQYVKSQEHNIIFCVAFQDFLKIAKIDVLLEKIKFTYIDEMLDQLIIEDNLIKSIPPFKEQFEAIVNQWNMKNLQDQKKQKSTKTFYQTKRGQEVLKTTQQGSKISKEQAEKQIETAANKKQEYRQRQFQDSGDSNYEDDNDEDLTEEQLLERNRQAMKQKFSGKKSPTGKGSFEQSDDGEKKPIKQKREKTNIKITQSAMNQLDKSSMKDNKDITKMREEYMGEANPKIENFYDSDEESDEEEEKQESRKGFFSKFTNQIKVLTGNKVIDQQDLEPVLLQFKEHLSGKNVAEEISQKICESIKINLLKTKSTAFSSINKLVKESLNSALTKVLTPKKNIDPIAEALRARERGKPYVITFIGVNGVGKSTNLAKIAYLFKSQGFKIMLAACDNFRAGAVEQIKTHGRCLDVPVFDKGYGQDAADIAFEAIREATLKKYDVVLIDTAGRMQDNEPLMRQLSKLVVVNNPDLIVFIGEALVGNDGFDQLTKFNKALIDLSPRDNVREIDGIILSKFDTVDDKVGAAITMTYSSGKPILFVGVGQKYTHLKKLNSKTVVHSLMN